VRKLQVSSNVNTASGKPSLFSHARCALKIAQRHLRDANVRHSRVIWELIAKIFTEIDSLNFSELERVQNIYSRLYSH